MSTPCDLELFKQALSDGLDTRYKIITESYDGDVTPSKKHEDIMNSIMRGVRKPIYLGGLPLRKAVAVALIAAMMTFVTSCAPIQEILRDFVREIKDGYVYVTPPPNNATDYITKVYTLSYLPEGYELTATQVIGKFFVSRSYSNADGDTITFEQSPRNTVVYGFAETIDESDILEFEDYNVYYATNGSYYYIWYDENYAYRICSDTEISLSELQLIIDGRIPE